MRDAVFLSFPSLEKTGSGLFFNTKKYYSFMNAIVFKTAVLVRAKQLGLF
jgi:hypothetical protein